MSNATKIWLIISAALILVGGIVFGGVMAELNWDFSKLSTVKYQTNEYELNEGFQNISIETDTADIVLVPSENGKSSVVCYEQKNLKHSVTVKDETLVIEVVDTREWYEHIGIFFSTPKITVYLPQSEFGKLSVRSDTGDVKIPKDFKFRSIDISQSTGDATNYASASDYIKIKTSTGDIRVENISAGMLDLTASTGNVTAADVTSDGSVKIDISTGRTNLSNITCKNVVSDGSTGDMILKNVIAVEKISIKISTGDISLSGCDAAEIFLKTSTGDVKGNLLSDKVFFAESNTGKVNVPKTMTGGRCEIYTSTGNIKIEIK